MPISNDHETPKPVVFKTPPSTTKPDNEDPIFHSPKNVVSPPPVQPPPQHIDNPLYSPDGFVVGFFRNAISKVQNANSILDDRLARWFGLNQSKYQWALDHYCGSKGLEKDDSKAKEMSKKLQSV